MVEGRELVQKLVRGSENIDRMKREIDLVVKTVVGLIPIAFNEPDTLHFNSKKFGFFNCGFGWEINLDQDEQVVCQILVGGGKYSLVKGVSRFPEIGKVEEIRNGLHVLMTGLMQFKEMRKHLAPFFDAADYKF